MLACETGRRCGKPRRPCGPPSTGRAVSPQTGPGPGPVVKLGGWCGCVGRTCDPRGCHRPSVSPARARRRGRCEMQATPSCGRAPLRKALCCSTATRHLPATFCVPCVVLLPSPRVEGECLSGEGQTPAPGGWGRDGDSGSPPTGTPALPRLL